MLISNHRNILLTVVVSLFLIVGGCGDSSTDSGGEDNNNQNQSTTFSSGPIAPGDTFSHNFEEEGTVDYYCTIHAPNMTGQVTVTSNVEAVNRDTVNLEGNQFVPEDLEVAPGTEVVWINNQDHNHDIKTGAPSSNGNTNY